MTPERRRTEYRGSHHTETTNLAWLGIAICALATAGCQEEVRNLGKRPDTKAPDQTGIVVGLGEPPGAQPKAKAPARDSGSIIGRRTQEILDAAPELQKGGAKVATTKITAKDYITLQGNVYVTTIGRLAIMSIQHAMDLYHATNDRYPKDYDEFMTEIVKANNIALPVLPPYQKYGYDEKEHKLIVLEYPALKALPPPQE